MVQRWEKWWKRLLQEKLKFLVKKAGKEEKESQKVEEKVDFSIELEKNRKELHREKVARHKGNEKMIVLDDVIVK